MNTVTIKSFLTFENRAKGDPADVYARRDVTSVEEFKTATKQMGEVDGSRLYLDYFDENGVRFEVTGFGMGPYENAVEYLSKKQEPPRKPA